MPVASHTRSHDGLVATWLIIACCMDGSVQTYPHMRSRSMQSDIFRHCLAEKVPAHTKLERKLQMFELSVPWSRAFAAALPSPNVRSNWSISGHHLPTAPGWDSTTDIELPRSSSASAATEHGWMIATQLRLSLRCRLYPAGSHRRIISHAQRLGLARSGHMFPSQNSICTTMLSPQLGPTTQSRRRPLACDGAKSSMVPRGTIWQTIDCFTPTSTIPV